MTATRARAVYQFDAEDPRDLGFKVGQEITVVDTSLNDWWIGEIGDNQGCFPTNYVVSHRLLFASSLTLTGKDPELQEVIERPAPPPSNPANGAPVEILSTSPGAQPSNQQTTTHTPPLPRPPTSYLSVDRPMRPRPPPIRRLLSRRPRQTNVAEWTPVRYPSPRHGLRSSIWGHA